MISETLTEEQKKKLLKLARTSIADGLSNTSGSLSDELLEEISFCRGLFVTLRIQGKLRGCIGQMSSTVPLPQAVYTVARDSAFHDPRFPAFTKDELDQTRIEISVLSPSVPARDKSEIVLGVHGVRMEYDSRSAVFLPQVALEQGWNIEELFFYLEQKGRFPEGSSDKAQLSIFTADIFEEER
jgi:AmmeMemoRadiSam system protein A